MDGALGALVDDTGLRALMSSGSLSPAYLKSGQPSSPRGTLGSTPRAHMKISCQSCQSKYNVADEKVQGKIVKIRCRKCGSTIVVDGTKQSATNGSVASATAAAAAIPPSGKADGQAWHVNVAEDDQRTMTLGELVAAYGSGVVTQETFIWTEGMEDWKPLSEVEPVVLALHDAAAASLPNSPGKSSNGFGNDLRAAAGSDNSSAVSSLSENEALDGSDPTRIYDGQRPAAAAAPTEPSAGLGVTASSPARAEPKRAAIKREPRTRDLFASRVSADEVRSGGGSEAGGAMLQMAGSTAAPTDDVAAKRLGERNENSVLFSLAMLTKTADIPASSEAVPQSADDDSGLIDLKALAAKTESLRPGAMAADNAFSAPIGAMQPLGAPIGTMAPPLGEVARKSRLPAVIGGGALLVLLLAAGIMIGVKLAGSHAPPVATIATEPSTPAVPAVTASAPADTAAAPSATTAASQSPSATPTAAPARPRATGGGTYSRPQGVAGNKPPSGGAAGGATGEAPAAPAPKKPASDCGCNGDLMCLMKCSTH